jgi:hypothetical protein
MQIEQIKTEKLIPYARNSRLHSQEQIAQISASIREFGFNNPVLIDKDHGIIAGHGRVLAAQKLGLDEVPCLRLSHLTDIQKRAYIIADNRLAETGGGWDTELLALEIEDLRLEDFDIDLTGFDADAIDALFDEAAGGDDGDGENPDNNYSRKIEAPIYKITGEKPAISELLDRQKAETLRAEIDATDLPDDVAEFLRHAAERHVVFNFRNIAEFYAHADAKTQDLMERSALIIIDFQRAIEEGFVKLSEAVAEQYAKDYPDEG